MLTIALIAALAAHQAPATGPDLSVKVDSSRHRVVVTAGSFTIPGASGAAHHGGMHQAGSEAPLMRFTWPVKGWARGVSLSIKTSSGADLPRRLVHHINVINFGRRQLLYPAPERMIAMGQETEDIRLPASVGIPVEPGMPMGLIVAWHNEDHEDIEDVVVTLSVEYSPENMYPRPISVLPVYMDVVYPIARAADFDLPPGPQVFSAEFQMPINGRIIGAGGHLHDHGQALTLDEVLAGQTRPLLRLDTRRDSTGRVLAVDRKYPGISGSGIKLTNGTTYRMSGRYQNPTGETLAKGAMVHLILLFAPEDVARWPQVDMSNTDYAKDVAFIEGRTVSVDDR